MTIIAHRGASQDAPENTVAAVLQAWAQGADAVEVDVQLTRDGRLAVIHDPDTARTAGVARTVGASTWEELQSLDVGRWKGALFAGERIPALEDVLALVPAGKRIFIEIKGGPEGVDELQRVVRWARQRHALQARQAAIIGFSFDAVVAAKRALPEHEVCWLADSGSEAPLPTLEAIARRARDAGLDGIDVDAAWELTAPIVRSVHAAGATLYAWTVDDAALARRLRDAGVDGLTTNRPGWLRRELQV